MRIFLMIVLPATWILAPLWVRGQDTPPAEPPAEPAAAPSEGTGAAELNLHRGIEAFARGDFRGARRFFDSALQHNPTLAAAHYLKGLTLLKLATTVPAADRADLYQQASESFRASQLFDPELVLAFLDDGIAQTQLGQFEAAEASYKVYMESNPNDAWPYVFMGVLYYRQVQRDAGFVDQAMANLDRAEQTLADSGRTDPELASAISFYRALLQIEMDDLDAAQQSAEAAVQADPNSVFGQNSREVLEQIERHQIGSRKPWDLTIGIGAAYDTNVILQGESVVGDARRRQNDYRAGISTAFDFRLLNTRSTVIGTGFSTFNTWHDRIDEFDVQTYGGNAYIAHTPTDMDWMTLSLRYDYDYTLVGRESFLARHRLTPQIDLYEADWTSTTLFYQFERDSYHNQPDDGRLDRDGHTHAFGAQQRFRLWELFDDHVQADVGYRFEDDQTEGTEFDAENHVFDIGFLVPLPWSLTFEFSNEFALSDYQNRSIFDRKQRRDCLHTMIFALTKVFDENWSLRFEVDVFDNDSNIRDFESLAAPFSYDRVIYGLMLQYSLQR